MIRDFTAHINAFKISPKGIQDAIIGLSISESDAGVERMQSSSLDIQNARG